MYCTLSAVCASLEADSVHSAAEADNKVWHQLINKMPKDLFTKRKKLFSYYYSHTRNMWRRRGKALSVWSHTLAMNPSLLCFYGMDYVVTESQTDPEPLDVMHESLLRSTINQTVVLTNTNWSKLRGDQGTSAELIIGRNWSPVEEAIRTSRLEWGGSSGGSRGRRAGAHR